MAGLIEEVGTFYTYVRCGDNIATGPDHRAVVVKNWGEILGYTGSDYKLLSFILLEKFKQDVDMGLIVMRDGRTIEVGRFSSLFKIPDSMNPLEIVRLPTLRKVKEMYPDFNVVHNLLLSRDS